MDKKELTLADCAKIIRTVRAIPSEELVPVVVRDPITGELVIKWVHPEPPPDATLDYDAVLDEKPTELLGQISALEADARPADLLSLYSDLHTHADGLRAAGRLVAAEALAVEAVRVFDVALTRMG